jgi:LPXTG-motif cell wall-anchored protein
VNAFRLLALAYALAALLIAPSWLAADELPTGEAAPPPAAQEPAPAPGAAAVVAPAPEPAEPADEAPVAVAQEAEEPSAEQEEPAAKVAEEEPKSGEPVAKAAADGTVTISDFKFFPKTITVNEGDSVTWNNNGPTLHTATAEDGSFDTGNLNKGDSDTITFDSAGRIPYICTPHPFMKGTVVVKAASSGSGGSDSDTDGGEEPTVTTADDTASGSDDDSDGLPATGFETLAIALLGMGTLGAGLLLRRRDQARD